MDGIKVVIDDRVGVTLELMEAPSGLTEFVFEPDLTSVEAKVRAGATNFEARVRDGNGLVVLCRFIVVRAEGLRAVSVERIVSDLTDLESTQEILAELAMLLDAFVVVAASEHDGDFEVLSWIQNNVAAPVPSIDSYRAVLAAVSLRQVLLVESDASKMFPDATLFQELNIESLYGLRVPDGSGTSLICLFQAQGQDFERVKALMSLAAKALAADSARIHLTGELAWANERFRVAVSVANIGVWDFNFSNEMVVVEGNEKTSYQQKSGELRSWGKPIHAADVPRVEAAFATAVADHQDFQCSFRVLDGETVRYFESFGRPVFLKGRPIRMIGAHVDVTLQREAELRAVDQSRRLELLLSSAGMGSWDWDPNTDIVTGAAKVHAPVTKGFSGTRTQFPEQVSPEDRTLISEWLDTCLSGAGPSSIVHRVELEGEVRWIQVRGDRIVDDQGCMRVIGLVWDITESRDRMERLAIAEGELRRMNERYSIATGAAGAGLWEADLVTDEFTWNPRLAEIFGVTGDDEPNFGQTWWQRIHPDDIGHVNAEIRLAEIQETASTSFRVLLPNGEIRHVRSFAHYVHEAGQHEKLIGLTLDMTAEREDELRERNRTRVLEKLVSSAPMEEVLEALVRAIEAELPGIRVGFMLVDAHGDRLQNASAPSMPGSYLEAAQNLQIGEGNGSCGSSAALQQPVLVHDVSTHPYWERFREFAAAADFRACWSIPIIGRGGKTYGTLAAYFRKAQTFDEALLRRLNEAADFASLAISRKNDELGLQNREILLRTTGAIAKVAGWDVDLRTDTRQWTEQMYELHGLDPDLPANQDEVIGLYSPESQIAIRDLMAKTFADGSAQDVVAEMVSRDGTHRWVRMAGRAVFEDGRPIKLVGATQDITSEYEAAAERERLREQLVQAQKMESVGRLAGGVAHDFNNFLSVILGHTELALSDLPPESVVAGDLDAIRQAAERSAALTRQLLAFARKQPIAPTQINLNATITEMVSMLRRMMGERISLIYESDPKLWDVFVDPSQIDQILANLCVNARDAIEGDGKVTIRTKNHTVGIEEAAKLGGPQGDYVCLSVSDNGAGIPETLIGNVFEPFFTTKAIGAGTGLGLATVYGIVKQNRGCIFVTSDEGVGTTFDVFFPKRSGTSTTAVPKASTTSDAGTCRILLVEDEPALLKLAKRMIRMGHEVITAASPDAALEIGATAQTIDVLISDVIMPGMNGRQLADELQKIRPEMRRVFVSGYTAEIMEFEGMLREGEYFLQKPFNSRDLQHVIEKCLEEPS